jgi:hypothetical protein
VARAVNLSRAVVRPEIRRFDGGGIPLGALSEKIGPTAFFVFQNERVRA